MIPEAQTAITLSVSVVLHDSDLDLLRSTLTSLETSIAAARAAGLLASASVRLLDNASPPEYRSALETLVQELRASWGGHVELSLALGRDNPGFGAGHNRAQAQCREQAGADHVLILNPDVYLEENALSEGLAYLHTTERVVALSPHCTRPDGSREYLCKRYPSLPVLLLRGFGGSFLRNCFAGAMHRYEYRDLPEAPAPVVLLSGACLLCRASAFIAVDGFDEAFFMYFEDFDLCRRLDAHGELHYLPAMRIRHHGGFAARKGWRHRLWFFRSALRFFHRHGWRAPRTASRC